METLHVCVLDVCFVVLLLFRCWGFGLVLFFSEITDDLPLPQGVP